MARQFAHRFHMTTVFAVALTLPGVALSVDLSSPDRWWCFDETDGASVADASGNDIDGVVHKAQGDGWTAGRVGGALALDGADDYVDFDDNSLPAAEYYKSRDGSFTVAMWVYLQSDKAMSLVRRSDEPAAWWSNPRSLRVVKKDGGPMVLEGFVYDGTPETATGASPLATDTWYHVVMVAHTGGGARGLRIYLDGALETSAFFGAPGNWPQDSWHIGRGNTKGFAHLHGKVDDARIYNAPLSDDEVAALYRLAKEAGAAGDATKTSARLPRTDTSFYLQPGDRVMLVGDATTVDGEYARLARDRIRDEYDRLESVSFVNAASAGATARGMSAALPGLIARHRPTVAVVCLGANDALEADPRFSAKMKSIVSKLAAASVPVTILTPLAFDTRGREHLAPHAAALRELVGELRKVASTKRARLADCHAAAEKHIAEGGEDLSWGDGVHPNDRGRRMMAEVLLTAWGIEKPLSVAPHD